MSIETTVARHFRDLGQALLDAAEAIESGTPVSEADPLRELLKATSRYVGGFPDLELQYQRSAQSGERERAADHELGKLILTILTISDTGWSGTPTDLADAASEFEIAPDAIDTAWLNLHHWFARGISLAGARINVVGDQIRLRRHNWFAPLRDVSMPTLEATQVRGNTTTKRTLLYGSWVSRGIDPETCVYCLSGPFQEIEHFIPRARGGSDAFSNLFPACIQCNRGSRVGKWDRDPWEWLRQQHPNRIAYFQEVFDLRADE